MHHGVSHRRLSPDELGDVTLKFARFSEGCFSMCCFHPTKRISLMSKTGFLKSPGWRTDCCTPSFYLGSESDVSDFTTIKTSKKTAICFRSRPVCPLRSGTGVLIPHLFGTRRATQKFSKSQSPNLFGQYR